MSNGLLVGLIYHLLSWGLKDPSLWNLNPLSSPGSLFVNTLTSLLLSTSLCSHILGKSNGYKNDDNDDENFTLLPSFSLFLVKPPDVYNPLPLFHLSYFLQSDAVWLLPPTLHEWSSCQITDNVLVATPVAPPKSFWSLSSITPLVPLDTFFSAPEHVALRSHYSGI